MARVSWRDEWIEKMRVSSGLQKKCFVDLINIADHININSDLQKKCFVDAIKIHSGLQKKCFVDVINIQIKFIS